MNWRWTDRVALGCFVGALLLFVGFNVLVIESQRWSGEWQTSRGWEIWEAWWEGVKDFSDLEWFGVDAIVWAAIQLVVLLLIGSPMAIPALSSNRLIWWLICVTSGLSLVVIDGYLIWYQLVEFDSSNERIGPGLWCLFAAPVVHFIGVLFVRRHE